MRLKSLLNENITNEFVKFVANELQIKSLPAKIKFVGSDYSKEHLTFGTYHPDTEEIVIVKGDRHIADVLRTLAHEMVHHKQRMSGDELNGEDGSDTENEANAKAGELMRKFRKVRPELYLGR
jgi:Zn-dependent peptidase ImmA (M78 family)